MAKKKKKKKKKKKVYEAKAWSPGETGFSYIPWHRPINLDSSGRPVPESGGEYVHNIGHFAAIVDAAGEDKVDFSIQFGGFGRSSKYVTHYSDGAWEIINQIDYSFQDFDTLEELLEETHIGEALENGALVWTGTG